MKTALQPIPVGIGNVIFGIPSLPSLSSLPSRPLRPSRDTTINDAPDPFPRSARVAAIERIVAQHLNITLDDLHSRSTKHHLVWARRITYAIANEVLGLKESEIEHAFKLGHATAYIALERLQDRLETEPASFALYQHLLARCQKAAGYPNDELP